MNGEEFSPGNCLRAPGRPVDMLTIRGFSSDLFCAGSQHVQQATSL